MRLPRNEYCSSPKEERAFNRMVELEKTMSRSRTVGELEIAYAQAVKVWDYNFGIKELFANGFFVPDHIKLYNSKVSSLR